MVAINGLASETPESSTLSSPGNLIHAPDGSITDDAPEEGGGGGKLWRKVPIKRFRWRAGRPLPPQLASQRHEASRLTEVSFVAAAPAAEVGAIISLAVSRRLGDREKKVSCNACLRSWRIETFADPS